MVAALVGCLAVAEPARSAPRELELTLAECVLLAIRNNRDLAAGRLDRLAARLSLEDAEDEFRLAATVEVAADRDLTTSTLAVSPSVTLRIPTGGRFRLGANGTVTDQASASQFVELEFMQPLLKGAGYEIATAGVARARRTEESGVLTFKAAVMGLVTRTISAYRNVGRSTRAVEIAERSLQRARELLETNRSLVEAGRMAAQDIVRTEASVAERELSVSEARGALDDARLALVGLLDIDDRTVILPADPLRVDPNRLEHDVDRGVELALRNRPDYRQALLAIENADTALLVADDARKWDLNVTAAARVGHRGSSLAEAYGRFDPSYRVGVRLRIPLGADSAGPERNWQKAEIAVQKSRLRLGELRQAIELEVRRAVRDVEVRLRRIELERQSRRLAERAVEVERVKLDAGLSSTFRVVALEDDLVKSRNSEVDAIIAYLNAVTALDQTLGTTLNTWQIAIDPAADGEAGE